MLRFGPLSYFGVSPVGFKPTTTFVDQIRILGRSFSYALWGQFAQTEGFGPPTFAFGEQRSTPELSLHNNYTFHRV